jgi:hypothetical protein
MWPRGVSPERPVCFHIGFGKKGLFFSDFIGILIANKWELRKMESIIPRDVLSALEVGRRNVRKMRTRHLVVAGDRQHRIMTLTGSGFVIEAEGLPHLRGYVEIMLGEERIARRLVVVDWARDGLMAYEFKHDASSRETPADYVMPERLGLLEAPEG